MAELGVDKYKPKHLGQVIGNTDLVRKLAEWLRDWDEVVLKGKVKEIKEEPGTEWMRFKPVPDNINARAALISGPPGIGKTTTSTLVARCHKKYKLMEFNASDARSKKVVDALSQSLCGNHTLKFGSDSSGSSLERTVIVMDECDGMAGGDVGGITALINMVKTTKNPVICICNDRSDSGIRKLAEHCLDMKFRRPEKQAIARRVKMILESDGKAANLSAIEATAEACGNDIRQVINQVQFFGTLATAGVSQKDTQVMMSPFDACTKLFARSTVAPLDKRLDMFFIDPDFMPLMVQENYLKSLEKSRPGETEEQTMAHCAYAAELIATSDMMRGDFSLMSASAAIGTIFPASLVSNDIALKPAFPAWLQKRSPQVKAQRIVQELHSRIRHTTTTTSKSLAITSYHDVLHKRLLLPLTFGDVKTCAAMLAGMGLTREFFTDHAPVLRNPLHLEDGYRKIEGAKKAQLLQELQNLQPKTAPPKKRKKVDEGRGDDEAGDDQAAAANDDDGGGMFKKKKTIKKTAAGSAPKKELNWDDKRAELQSLNRWKLKKVQTAEEIIAGAEAQKATLILKFIEGHTNAVRRKVQLAELLAPWRDF